MSLINQMLRDLEKRRKTEALQLPSGEEPEVVDAQQRSRRVLALAVGGLVLVGLIWVGLEFFPHEKFAPRPKIKLVPTDEQSQRIAIVRGKELFAALQEKSALPASDPSSAIEGSKPAGEKPVGMEPEKLQTGDVAPPMQPDSGSSNTEETFVRAADKSLEDAAPTSKNRSETGSKEAQRTAVKKTSALEPALPPPAAKKSADQETGQRLSTVSNNSAARAESRQASGRFVATLLNLGVLETLGSARLMFEFDRLPEYRWQLQGADNEQVRFRFKRSGRRQDLKIPPLNGPLLEEVSLQPGNDYLQFLVSLSRKVKVEVIELPADPFHGHRLLVELYSQQPAPGRQSIAQVSSVPVAPRAEKAREKKSSATNKVNKKENLLSREEQAKQAYQSALEQLRREDFPAAEATLSHALILQPRLLDARLQLVALLQKLRRTTEAEKQLELGLQLHPDNPDLRKNYSRVLLAQGQLEDAASLLEAEPLPEVSSDLEYHALLAALQQEVGNHKGAVNSYTQLLQYRPQEALWWMGLAISFEQSEDYVRAREAYRQALSLPGLRPDLQEFIQNRLQIL